MEFSLEWRRAADLDIAADGTPAGSVIETRTADHSVQRPVCFANKFRDELNNFLINKSYFFDRCVWGLLE
ncbi:hypothetical protein [Bordetella genomosp. 10]|uniref:hypothetical protein n=1 Tax=Bordetella genomosp. 10 TaxID=1416804 RepID=UPI001178675D|nr:hypothetical protein [Bordetella genomosp. 10]